MRKKETRCFTCSIDISCKGPVTTDSVYRGEECSLAVSGQNCCMFALKKGILRISCQRISVEDCGKLLLPHKICVCVCICVSASVDNAKCFHSSWVRDFDEIGWIDSYFILCCHLVLRWSIVWNRIPLSFAYFPKSKADTTQYRG